MQTKYNKTAVGNLKYLIQKEPGRYPIEDIRLYFTSRGLTLRDIALIQDNDDKFADCGLKKPVKKTFEELDQFRSLFAERERILALYKEALESGKGVTFFRRNSDSCYDLGSYYVFGKLEDGTIIPAGYGVTNMKPNLDDEKVAERVKYGDYRFPPKQYFKEIFYYPHQIKRTTRITL